MLISAAFTLMMSLHVLSRITCKILAAAHSLLLVQAVKLGTSSTLSWNGYMSCGYASPTE